MQQMATDSKPRKKCAVRPNSRADQVTENVLVALATHAGVANYERACECTPGGFAGGWAYTRLGVPALRYDQLMIHAGLRACIFDFRACISDKVKIHADLRACIFDVVYVELIRGGVHFGHLWCLRLPWGCCGGDRRAAEVATGCHLDKADRSKWKQIEAYIRK